MLLLNTGFPVADLVGGVLLNGAILYCLVGIFFHAHEKSRIK